MHTTFISVQLLCSACHKECAGKDNVYHLRYGRMFSFCNGFGLMSYTTYSTGLTHLDVYNVSNSRQIWTYNLKLFNDKLTIKTMFMNKFILLIIVFSIQHHVIFTSFLITN